MYDKGEFFTFEFSTPEGGFRTIRKTELEENNGFLKNPLYTLPKGTKRHNICSILPQNRKSCKNEIAYCLIVSNIDELYLNELNCWCSLHTDDTEFTFTSPLTASYSRIIYKQKLN